MWGGGLTILPCSLLTHTLTQLMLLIGEGFGDSSDQVCGAVVQIRARGDKLAIWTADQNKESDILHIG